MKNWQIQSSIEFKDLNIICQSCFKKVANALEKKEEIEKNLKEGREVAEKYVRTRSKRGIKKEISKIEKRKKLFKSDDLSDVNINKSIAEKELDDPTPIAATGMSTGLLQEKVYNYFGCFQSYF